MYKRLPRAVGLWRLLVVVACIVGISACSRAELFYRNADWLAYRWVDGLLDADSEQGQRWSALLEDALQQHREELLADVVAWLDATAQRTDAPMPDDQLRCLWDHAETVLQAHARLFVEPAVQILADGVTVQQVDHLAEELRAREEEYRERYLDPDPVARHAARVERFTERIERWTGNLSVDQRRLVADAVERMPDVTAAWLDYRDGRQRQLLALLRRGASSDTLRAFLVDWWVEQRGRPDTLVQGYAGLKQGWLTMLTDLDHTLSTVQREHVRAHVSELRDDLAGELGRVDPGFQRVGQAVRGEVCPQPL